MRTTVTLDDDVARALAQLRREEGLGTSAALNTLVRRGLAAGPPRQERFVQRTSAMGPFRISLDNVEEALEVLEGDAHR